MTGCVLTGLSRRTNVMWPIRSPAGTKSGPPAPFAAAGTREDLRIILEAQATVMWSTDDWSTRSLRRCCTKRRSHFGMPILRLPTGRRARPLRLRFTSQRSGLEERKWRIVIASEDIVHGNGQTKAYER